MCKCLSLELVFGNAEALGRGLDSQVSHSKGGPAGIAEKEALCTP